MTQWPMLPLSEVMVLCLDAERVDPSRSYKFAGVYSFGRGLFVRGYQPGSNTTYKTFNRLHANDFVISQPKAWEGAIARVTDEFEGCWLSPVFPTFRADTNRIVPEFLDWFLRRECVWHELHQKAKGMGARRESVSPAAFLSIRVPLPPLNEQRRLVEYLDILKSKCEESMRLATETSEAFEELCRSILRDSALGAPCPTPMNEIVRLRDPDVVVKADEDYHFAGVYCFGRGVFVGQHKSGMDFQYPRLTRLRTDDFVYPKLMAWEGALAVVPPECDGLVVSTEFPVFEIDQSKVLPEVLDVYFKTPSVWPALSGASTGTNVRRKRLNPTDFLKYQMPLPSKESQQRLRKIRTMLSDVSQGRIETIKELDAMLPSVLHSFFNNGDHGEAT